MRLALAQFNPVVGDVRGNATRIAELAVRARDALRADAILLPELALTGYPPEDLLLRPDFLDAVDAAAARLAQAVPDIALVLGLPLRQGGALYNSALLLHGGQERARYHKQHLPNFGVFDERRYFTPGHAPCVADIAGLACGLSICEDIWHPGPAAQARTAGAACLLNLNASPFHLGKHAERAAVVRARVAETGLPVVYLNQVGGQDELVFDGDSFVSDAHGTLTLRLPPFAEALEVVELPRSVTGPVRLDDADEASLYAALLLGVRDYVRKNDFPGVLLGLSGGVDSALVLCLAADALGAAQVTAVLMPSRYTASMSNEDALAQCAALGVAHHLIPIEPAFHTLLDMLAGPFAGAPPDVTEENLQSRIRGLLLMALSNKTGRLLLSTGNKSELATGYATLYGDMNGGFAPLKDVSKTWVYRLGRWRNAQGPAPVIPERVLTRPPSAELRPDQTDQDSLPDYAVLDRILEGFVEQDESVERLIARGLPAAEVRRVAALILRNEYKRRQAPPGVRVTRRAFGRDRRYPITSGYR